MTNFSRQFLIDDQFSSSYTDHMLTNILKSFHLTDKETKVFLKVLSLGAQPASHIARVCEMPRNTVRSMLDGLVKKGLMIKTNRAHTQYYATENKDNLIRALKFRRLRIEQDIDHQIDLLETYGDELTSRHWAQSRPRITFYEGIAGLEKVYEDTLTAKTGLKSWASYDDLYESMPRYFESYFKRRAQKNIPMRSIHPDSQRAREGQMRDGEELRESALVPADKFTWTPEIQIYDDKINIASWKEKLSIIIESREVADALRAIFDLSYEAAKQYGKVSMDIGYDARIKE